jgi:twitching motility protein PilT
MVPAVEIMICSTAVRNCIRENRIFEIPNIIETGQRLGMQSIDQSIAELLSRRCIHENEALAKCADPARMHTFLSRNVAEWA